MKTIVITFIITLTAVFGAMFGIAYYQGYRYSPYIGVYQVIESEFVSDFNEKWNEIATSYNMIYGENHNIR